MRFPVSILIAVSGLFVVSCVSPGERAADLASGAFAGGNYNKSYAAAVVLISEEPENPLGYILAGDSLVQLKRYQQSVPYYEALLGVLDRKEDQAKIADERAATKFKLGRAREERGWTSRELISAIAMDQAINQRAE